MDRDALSYAYSIQGHHAHEADRLRREAADLESKARGLRGQADDADKHARWAGELATALAVSQGLCPCGSEATGTTPGGTPECGDPDCNRAIEYEQKEASSAASA